jgi:ribosomal protein S18 acetylase RimI-like enzyme
MIRAARLEDVDALYKICLETGDSGDDATTLYDDPELLGHIFAAPYAIFEPSLAFVAEDAEGAGGYVLGALDTRAFADTLERDWWPKLRERYPETAPRRPADQDKVTHIHHPPGIPDSLYADYPSHLHIDLLPRMQGQGLGGKIMRTLLDALRAQGSRGVHLQVWARNQRAIGFYRHLGFTEIGRDDDGFTLGIAC